jgi:hypothetical protein
MEADHTAHAGEHYAKGAAKFPHWSLTWIPKARNPETDKPGFPENRPAGSSAASVAARGLQAVPGTPPSLPMPASLLHANREILKPRNQETQLPRKQEGGGIGRTRQSTRGARAVPGSASEPVRARKLAFRKPGTLETTKPGNQAFPKERGAAIGRSQRSARARARRPRKRLRAC